MAWLYGIFFHAQNTTPTVYNTPPASNQRTPLCGTERSIGLTATSASQPIRRYSIVDRTEKCSTNHTLKRIPAIANPQMTANRDQPQLPRKLTSKNGV